MIRIIKVRATYQQYIVPASQQLSPLEQGTGISNGLLEVIVGWKKGIMMSDKKNEIESDIPAARRITFTANISVGSARARKRHQPLIFGSQGSRSVGRKG